MEKNFTLTPGIIVYYQYKIMGSPVLFLTWYSRKLSVSDGENPWGLRCRVEVLTLSESQTSQLRTQDTGG